LCAELCGEAHEEGFVDAEALYAVGGEVAVAGEVPVGHADGGGEAAEEEARWFQDAPGSAQHGQEVIVIARKMQDSTAEHHIGKAVWKRHSVESLQTEVLPWERRRKRYSESARSFKSLRIRVRAKNLVPFPKKIDEVATETTARIQDSHPGNDTSSQNLVKKINVYLAELLAKVRHGYLMTR